MNAKSLTTFTSLPIPNQLCAWAETAIGGVGRCGQQNVQFVAPVSRAMRFKATQASSFVFSTVSLCLQLAQMPRSRDLVIFA